MMWLEIHTDVDELEHLALHNTRADAVEAIREYLRDRNHEHLDDADCDAERATYQRVLEEIPLMDLDEMCSRILSDYDIRVEVLEVQSPGWSEHDKYYAGVALQQNGIWHGFVGRVFLIGIELGLTIEQITDYLWESVHGLSQEEIPLKGKDIRKDLKLYKEATSGNDNSE